MERGNPPAIVEILIEKNGGKERFRNGRKIEFLPPRGVFFPMESTITTVHHHHPAIKSLVKRCAMVAQFAEVWERKEKKRKAGEPEVANFRADKNPPEANFNEIFTIC